jgi:hypothetical protein
MANQEVPDFIYPMTMGIYYPIVDQGVYGNVKKQWLHDRTVVCNLSSAGGAATEEIKPNINIKQEVVLFGRVKSDIRISNREAPNGMTNIIVSNICDRTGHSVYVETSGPRVGKPTIFEIVSNEPTVGPFGNVEFYKIVLKRSENQAVDL